MDAELQRLYGTTAPFLTSPPNLVVTKARVTEGERYVAPREVMFGNPGVISVGQFPTWYDSIPNAKMWEDEAYNTAKRMLAEETQNYLKQDVRTMFAVEDPNVRLLIEESEKGVERAIEDITKLKAMDKQQRQIDMLLNRGIPQDRAVQMVTQVEEERAIEALRRGDTLPNPRRALTFGADAALRGRPRIASPAPTARTGRTAADDEFDTPATMRTQAAPVAPSTAERISVLKAEVLENGIRSTINMNDLRALARSIGVKVGNKKKATLLSAVLTSLGAE
jgi:hypothetical protein